MIENINFQIIWSNFENLYIQPLSFLTALRAVILNKPGIKYITKGYIKEVIKPIMVSDIKWICVFLYTPQKQVIKYQKN